jgi:exoribonuclease R
VRTRPGRDGPSQPGDAAPGNSPNGRGRGGKSSGRSSDAATGYWPLAVVDPLVAPHSLPLPTHWEAGDDSYKLLSGLLGARRDRDPNVVIPQPEPNALDAEARAVFLHGLGALQPNGTVATDLPAPADTYAGVDVLCEPLSEALPLPPRLEAQRLLARLKAVDQASGVRDGGPCCEVSNGADFALLEPSLPSLPGGLVELVEGQIRVQQRDNFAFLAVEGLDVDITVDHSDLNRALADDWVVALVNGARDWKACNMSPAGLSAKQKAGKPQTSRERGAHNDAAGRWFKLFERPEILKVLTGPGARRVLQWEWLRQLAAHYRAVQHGVREEGAEADADATLAADGWLEAWQEAAPQRAAELQAVRAQLRQEASAPDRRLVDDRSAPSIASPSRFGGDNLKPTTAAVLAWYQDLLPPLADASAVAADDLPQYKDANPHATAALRLPLPLLERFPAMWAVKMRLAILHQFFPSYSFRPTASVVSVRHRMGTRYVPRPVSLARVYSHWIAPRDASAHTLASLPREGAPSPQPWTPADRSGLRARFPESTAPLSHRPHITRVGQPPARPRPRGDGPSSQLLRGYNHAYAQFLLTSDEVEMAPVVDTPQAVFGAAAPSDSLMPRLPAALMRAFQGRERCFTSLMVAGALGTLADKGSKNGGRRGCEGVDDSGFYVSLPSQPSAAQWTLALQGPDVERAANEIGKATAKADPGNVLATAGSKQARHAADAASEAMDHAWKQYKAAHGAVRGWLQAHHLVLHVQDLRQPDTVVDLKFSKAPRGHEPDAALVQAWAEADTAWCAGGPPSALQQQVGKAFVFPSDFVLAEPSARLLQACPRLHAWALAYHAYAANVRAALEARHAQFSAAFSKTSGGAGILGGAASVVDQLGQLAASMASLSLAAPEARPSFQQPLPEGLIPGFAGVPCPDAAFRELAHAASSLHVPALYIAQYTDWPPEAPPQVALHQELAGRDLLESKDKVLPVLLRNNVVHTDEFAQDVTTELKNIVAGGEDAPADDAAPAAGPKVWQVPAAEVAARTDLRSKLIFSVDPVTARDLDDALSVEHVGAGVFRVGVHIADVSHFVHPGGHTDLEAQRRATSVYLTGFVVPMLPRILCEELCSLNGGVDRLAFSCFFLMNEQGEILDVDRRLRAMHTKRFQDASTPTGAATLGEAVTLTKQEAARQETGAHPAAAAEARNALRALGLLDGEEEPVPEVSAAPAEQPEADDVEDHAVSLDVHGRDDVEDDESASEEDEEEGRGQRFFSRKAGGRQQKAPKKKQQHGRRPAQPKKQSARKLDAGADAGEAWERFVGESAWYGKSVIRSAAKLDYRTCQLMVNCAELDPHYDELMAQRDAAVAAMAAEDPVYAASRGRQALAQAGVAPYHPRDVALKLGLHSDEAIRRQVQLLPELRELVKPGERCAVAPGCAQFFGQADDASTGDALLCDVVRASRLLHSLGMHRREDRFARFGSLTLNKNALAFKFTDEAAGYEALAAIEAGQEPPAARPRHVSSVTSYPMQDTNSMIEEFMLMANILVAQRIHRVFPDRAMLRLHPLFSLKYLQDTVNLLRRFGVLIDISSAGAMQRSIDLVARLNEDFNARADALEAQGPMVAPPAISDDLWREAGAVAVQGSKNLAEFLKNEGGKGIELLPMTSGADDKRRFEDLCLRFRRAGTSMRLVVEEMLVRSMRRALYFCAGVRGDKVPNDHEPLYKDRVETATTVYERTRAAVMRFRHFALNFDFYTHFTSPIRRYPDVVVHRLLEASLFKENVHNALPYAPGYGASRAADDAPDPLVAAIARQRLQMPLAHTSVCEPLDHTADPSVFALVQFEPAPAPRTLGQKRSIAYGAEQPPAAIDAQAAVSNTKKAEAKSASDGSALMTLVELLVRRVQQRNGILGALAETMGLPAPAPADKLGVPGTVAAMRAHNADVFSLRERVRVAQPLTQRLLQAAREACAGFEVDGSVRALIESFCYELPAALQAEGEAALQLPLLRSPQSLLHAPVTVLTGVMLGRDKECKEGQFCVFVADLNMNFRIDLGDVVGCTVTTGELRHPAPAGADGEDAPEADSAPAAGGEDDYSRYEREFDAQQAEDRALVQGQRVRADRHRDVSLRGEEDAPATGTGKGDGKGDKNGKNKQRNADLTATSAWLLEWEPHMAPLAHLRWGKAPVAAHDGDAARQPMDALWTWENLPRPVQGSWPQPHAGQLFHEVHDDKLGPGRELPPFSQVMQLFSPVRVAVYAQVPELEVRAVIIPNQVE